MYWCKRPKLCCCSIEDKDITLVSFIVELFPFPLFHFYIVVLMQKIKIHYRRQGHNSVIIELSPFSFLKNLRFVSQIKRPYLVKRAQAWLRLSVVKSAYVIFVCHSKVGKCDFTFFFHLSVLLLGKSYLSTVYRGKKPGKLPQVFSSDTLLKAYVPMEKSAANLEGPFPIFCKAVIN